MLRLTLCSALLGVVVAALPACGESNDESPDPRAQLEGIIRSQLPEKAKRESGQAVVVDSVQCTRAGGNKYECIASVKGSDGTGQLVAQDVSIDGTCDEDSCIWKTAGGDIPVPSPSSQEPPIDSSAGEDGIETVRAQLEGAGYDVADEEAGSDPGDRGGLVATVGKANFKVLFFESEIAAARTEGTFRQLVQESPNQVAVKRKGARLYVGTIEEPAVLPKEKFVKFVSDAGG